jgi:hypothetical protein
LLEKYGILIVGNGRARSIPGPRAKAEGGKVRVMLPYEFDHLQFTRDLDALVSAQRHHETPRTVPAALVVVVLSRADT